MRQLLLLSIIVIILSVHYTVQAESFGEWFTGITDSGELIYATTINDSGNLLGQYCAPSTGNCVWLLGMSTACKEDDQYPVLANSDVGAVHITVRCDAKLDKGLYRYVFTDFDIMNNIVTKGLRVGFAVPLQADQFRVVRFDLNGARRAITLMRAAAEEAHQKASSKTSGTKDQNL
ncbi:MAG: hypothetical protein WBJ16_00725 [Smithellaceae bacterium]|jgi:hypothetical protein